MFATLVLALFVPPARGPIASARLPLVASVLGALPAVLLDDADEQYAFIAGLAEKGMHDRVVKEAEGFLQQYPKHAKADAARYRLCLLYTSPSPRDS